MARKDYWHIVRNEISLNHPTSPTAFCTLKQVEALNRALFKLEMLKYLSDHPPTSRDSSDACLPRCHTAPRYSSSVSTRPASTCVSSESKESREAACIPMGGLPGSHRRSSSYADAAGGRALHRVAAPQGVLPSRMHHWHQRPPHRLPLKRRPRAAAAKATCGSLQPPLAGPASRTPALILHASRKYRAEAFWVDCHAKGKATAQVFRSRLSKHDVNEAMHAEQEDRTTRALRRCTTALRCAKDAPRSCRKLDPMSSRPRCLFASADTRLTSAFVDKIQLSMRSPAVAIHSLQRSGASVEQGAPRS